jgi:uncharacterized protein (TIGR03437 family)
VFRGFVICITLVVPSLAQFSQLAATDDGEQLYLVSPLALIGATAPAAATNVYQISPDGSGTLIATGGSMPEVSADGSVVGFTLPNGCVSTNGTTSCGPESELAGTPPTDLGPGTLQLSRNGRWAVLAPPLTPNSSSTAILVDLSSGQKTQIPPLLAGVNFSVASDGTVLVQQAAGNGVQTGLWKQGQFTPLRLSLPAGTPARLLALSDDAGTLIYFVSDLSSGPPGIISLAAHHFAEGTDTVLHFPSEANTLPEFLAVSSDGRYVLFQSGIGPSGTAYVGDTSSGTSQSIPLDTGEFVSAGTLSGSGNLAFLATTVGRIVTVPLAAGQPGTASVLVPAATYVRLPPPPYNFTQQVVPGSYVPLRGPVAGSVADWQGRILLGGRPVLVLAVQPGEVDVQIPWDQPPIGPTPLQLSVPGPSPFGQFQNINVAPVDPGFLQLPSGVTTILGIAWVKGDFSGYVTSQPSPGDIVNFYMTGLGQVKGNPVTGQPAQLDQLFPILGTITCRFLPQTTSADTLFAGLAPGMVGIYQVTFRRPNDPNQSPINGISCNLQQPLGGAGFGFVSL